MDCGETMANNSRRFANDSPRGLKQKTFVPLSFAGGLLALIWFLIRVIPKPSRALYPCQRAAFPIASAFVAYLMTLAGMVFAFRGMHKAFRHRKIIAAVVCIAFGAVALLVNISIVSQKSYAAFVPADPPNSPMGTAKGINPGRVVWVRDSLAAHWDGDTNTGHWWSDASTSQDAANQMISQSLQWLTGKTADATAWDTLFRNFNITHNRGNHGYQAGEKIMIKLNLNPSQSEGAWRHRPYPSPQVAYALLSQLVNNAHVPDSNITIGDPSRYVGDPLYNKCHADFPHIVFIGLSGTPGRTKAIPDTTASLHFADPNVSLNGHTYLETHYTHASYLINVGCLRGHNVAGFTACAKNHFGSLYRYYLTGSGASQAPVNDGWTPLGPDSMLGLHGYICPVEFDMSHFWGSGWKFHKRAMGTYTPLVELMGHKFLDGNGLLYLIDGLYAAENQSSEYVAKWSSAPFGTPQKPGWTSSVFVSQDEVAIESVILDFIRSEPLYNGKLDGNVDNYLHEASQAANPPSGTVYDPENDGTRLANLGVHEHWNNAQSKQYSRNLGTGNGIELISSQPPAAVAGRNAPGSLPGALDVSVLIATKGSITFGLALPSAGAFDLSVCDLRGRTVWHHSERSGKAVMVKAVWHFAHRDCATLEHCVVRLTFNGETVSRTIRLASRQLDSRRTIGSRTGS
jgi:hypothetical protein